MAIKTYFGRFSWEEPAFGGATAPKLRIENKKISLDLSDSDHNIYHFAQSQVCLSGNVVIGFTIDFLIEVTDE